VKNFSRNRTGLFYEWNPNINGGRRTCHGAQFGVRFNKRRFFRALGRGRKARPGNDHKEAPRFILLDNAVKYIPAGGS
jgi:hypothetical protein